MLTCRLATSNAWQEKDEESGLASAKHAAAASVPLDGLKTAFWVRNRLALHALSALPHAHITGVAVKKPLCLHAAPLEA